MSEHETLLGPSSTLVLVTVTLLASLIPPSLAMCETRCEHSIPSLNKLRSLWSRSFKRMGEVRVSFENFLLLLVQDGTYENDTMRQLRGFLLRIIARYQDCVMACEHQFSKRQSQSGHMPVSHLCQHLLFYQSKKSSEKALTEDVAKVMFSLCSSSQKLERLIV